MEHNQSELGYGNFIIMSLIIIALILGGILIKSGIEISRELAKRDASTNFIVK